MNNKKLNSTILFAASGIVILLLTGLIILNVMHIKKTGEEIENETITLQNNQSRLLSLKRLSESRTELEKSYDFLKNQIPPQPEEHKIIEQLETHAKQSGINLENIQFEERVQNNNLNEMPLKLSFKGKYPSFFKLLESISAGERLFRIDSIRISKGSEETGEIRADISAKAFYK